MLHVPVATVVIAFGGRLAGQLVPGGNIGLIVLAVLALSFASVASYRWFETPVRKLLNDAFDRSLAWKRLAAPVAADAGPGGIA
jgi:peptidoglycan/LPS O-acetylase OafA/YrhL